MTGATTTFAIELAGSGGIDQFRRAERPLPPPGAGEAQIRHTAIGVNFVDIYHRTGLYPAGPLPAVLGVEGAGVVTAVGPGVEGLSAGMRVEARHMKLHDATHDFSPDQATLKAL